jgi:hypothetical protein
MPNSIIICYSRIDNRSALLHNNSNMYHIIQNQREITKYGNVVESFLSHYYPVMKNAPDPKEVAKACLNSVLLIMFRGRSLLTAMIFKKNISLFMNVDRM